MASQNARGGGLLVLLMITVLHVYKPRGITPYGRRKQDEQPQMPPLGVTGLDERD